MKIISKKTQVEGIKHLIAVRRIANACNEKALKSDAQDIKEWADNMECIADNIIELANILIGEEQFWLSRCDDKGICMDDLKKFYNFGRADAIEEYKNKLKTDICVRSQNSYKDIFNDREREIFNFAIKTFLDALDYFAEQLKGQNK